MPKLRWIILPLGALGVLAAIVWLKHADRSQGPEQWVGNVTGRVKAEQYELALRELTRAVARAEAANDEEMLVVALQERAKVFMRTGLFRQATEDFDTLIDLRPESTDLLFEAGRNALLDEEYEQALRRFRRLIEVDPNHPGGWTEVGTTHRRLADEVLDRLTRHLEASLSGEDVQRALDLAGLITALPGESLRRQGATRRFDAMLPRAEDRDAAHEFLELAFDHLTESRRAYLRSLELWPDTAAIAGLLKLLERAQLSEEAADLGWFAFRTPGMQLQPRFLIETIEALERVGNDDAANRIAVEAVKDRETELYTYGLDNDEIPRFFDLQYRNEAWEPLLEQVEAFADLVKWLELPYANTVAYYSALAHLGLGEQLDALTNFADVQEANEPFPSAYLDTLFRRLEIARAEENIQEEKALMSSIVANQSELAWGEPNSRRVGEVWLRRGEIFLQENLVRQAEECFAHALSLMPGASDTIYPLWEEAGREASKTRGRTIEDVQDTFTRTPGYMADQGYGSFEYYATAQRFLQNLKPAVGLHALGIIDRITPGIPAVLDLQARSAEMLGRNDEEATALVRLAERTGASSELLARLEALPLEAFEDELALRRMRLNGGNIALPEMAREMAERDLVDEALAALEAYQGEERLGLRMLKAELYAKARRWSDCRDVFISAKDASAILARPGLALMSAVWGATGLKADAHLDHVVGTILSSRPPADPDLTRAIDALFAEKRTDEAFEILEHLDRYPEHVDADRLIRLGLAQTILLKRREARETFLRVEAFVETAEPILARLIQHVDSGDWDAVTNVAFELDDAEFAQNPYQQSLLRGLQGDPTLAVEGLKAIELPPRFDPRRRLAVAACEALLGDPERITPLTEIFVHTSPQRPDPRAILAMLLALEVDPFAAWVVKRLESFPPELTLNTWVLYLAAEGTLALDDLVLAERLYLVLSAQRGFAPAWIVRGELVADRYGEDSAHYLSFLDARVAALGAAALPTRVIVEYQVRLLAARGLPVQALAMLDVALSEVPDDDVLIRLRTRLLLQSGDRLAALNDYHERLDNASPEEQQELVPEVLELLYHMEGAGELSEVGWWSEVEALEAQLGRDPTLLRELVQRSIESNDPLAEAAAWNRAERFRSRVGDASLESLRVGSTRPWFELFAARDPERAADLVFQELLARPSSLELWRLWAEALDGRGETAGAWREVARLLPLFPDAELWRQGARLMARLAQDPMTVQAAAARATRLSPAHRTELAFLPQLAAYRRGDEMSSARLQAAWEGRKEIEDPLDVLLVARCYALTLMRSGSEEKQNLARHVLLEAADFAPDPLNRDIMAAYAAMSKAR